MTEAIEDQLERFAPGFRDVVLARHAMGPAAMEAHNRNYVGGDINGGAANLRQLLARPALRPVPYTHARPPAVHLLLVDAARRRGARDVRLAGGAGGSARHPPLILPILCVVALYHLAEDLPAIDDAVVIASFDGWVDAAEAASDAVAHIGAGGTVVATFDGDAIFDYRSRRPILDVEDGRLSELRWPELALRHVQVAGRDLLVFAGAEPDLRWQELASDVADADAPAGRRRVGQPGRRARRGRPHAGRCR